MFSFNRIVYFFKVPRIEFSIALAQRRAQQEWRRSVRRKMDAALVKITIDATNESNPVQVPGCLQYEKLKSILMDYPYEIGNDVSTVELVACNHFDQHKGPCDKLTCPKIQDNQDYFVARTEYENARQAVRHFWRDRVKECK